MKRIFKRSISVLLTLIMLMSCATAMLTPVSGVTENGYDRGYDGGFVGDGKVYCKGLDLSSWQKDAVNFTAIAASGYDYIILRLGTSKMTSVDPCFEEFYAGAKAAGLDVGAYFYSYATTIEAVQEDIAKCKKWLGDKKLEYPFYFDYEDKSQADLPTSTALSIINTFIDAFVEEGYLMGLYSMKAWITQSWITSSSLPTTYEGWVAHYAGDGSYDAGYDKYGDTYSTQYGMYQWTDKHYFTYNGVKYGPYDADLCYKDYPTIVKTYGFNNYEPSSVSKLKSAMDEAMSISHRNYTEATIGEIRSAYNNASALIKDQAATESQLTSAANNLTALLAKTGTNTIAYNNEGIEIKGRNHKITSGDCLLYSPTWNDGLITVSNANIAYTINVVFKWDGSQGYNVVKSITEGIGVNTPSIQLEADEFLIAAHDWESGVASGAVTGSAKNYSLLKSLSVGDRIKLSGATALNAGSDVEPAAFAKFLPKNSFAVYKRNEAVTTGSSALFTPQFNSGLITADNANIHLTLNVISKWDNDQNSWVVKEKFNGNGIKDESSNIELEGDEILFAAHYNTEDAASISNWCQLDVAKVGDKITFSGISPQAYTTGISISSNISFSEGATPIAPTPENLTASSDVTVTKPDNLTLDADLTDGVAGTTLDDEWMGLSTMSDSLNTKDSIGTVVIDLQKRYSLSTILAHFYVGNGSDTVAGGTVGAPESVTAYVSIDNANYYKLGELTLGECAIGTCWATLAGASSVARYIKLEIECNYDWILLNEVQVIGTTIDAVQGINVALGKDCVSPAYTGSPYTASLTDGKATSVFQPGVNNSSWFGFYNSGNEATGNINPNNNNRGIATIDLGGMAEITGVNIHHFVGNNSVGAVTYDYINVYYSTDGVAYDFLGTISPVASQTAPYWATIDASNAPVYARYVKFAVSGTQGELILLNEIQVIGTMLTGGPATQEGSISSVALVGTFNNWNATPNMKNIDENTVSLTMELRKGRYEFKILGGNSWYGHSGEVTNTTTSISPEGILFVYDGANNAVLNASGGTYTFIYNKMTNYLQILYVPDVCYLRGSFNDWGNDTPLEDMGDGKYGITLTLDKGSYEYKIANEDYTMEWPQFNATLELERKSEVTFTLDILSDTVSASVYGLEYTVTFLDRLGGTLSTQTVATGTAAVAPEAPQYSGYRFTGWNKDFSCVTEDMTVKALYDKTIGTLKVNVNGGTGFSISINDSNPRRQGTSYNNSNIPIGAKLTLTAITTNGNEFMGWVNPHNGKVLTTETVYTFYASGNDFVRAMFKTDIEGSYMVAFYNDKSKQYSDIQYYADGDDILFPTVDPESFGYTFKGWDMTEEEIKAEITADKDVTVKPIWEKIQEYITVNVTGGTVKGIQNSEGKFLVGYQTIATAVPASDGYKFAYWKDLDGNIKSYKESYTFYPMDDISLIAVYVNENDNIEYTALVSVDNFTPGTYGVFSVTWFVPVTENNLTFMGGGIIAVNASFYNEDTFYHGTTDTNVWDRTGSTERSENTYLWTGPVMSGETWYAKGWVQYIDAEGNVVTLYSDMFTATKE